MNKSTTILLLASLASIALGVGATLGVSYGFGIDYGKNETQETENTEGLETEVTEVKNMVVKRLSAETLANGDTVQTFSYTITPENATNQNINTAVTYQDDSGEATEITASINAEEKTITLTCHSAFNKVILVTLTAADGGGATATITCNYEKKIIGHEAQTFTFNFDEDGAANGDIFDYLIQYTDFFEYSKYTIDHDYTNGYMDQTQSAHDLSFKGYNSYTYSDNLSQKLTAIFNGEAYVATSEELWNLATSEDKAHLKSDNGYIYLSNAVDWGFTMHDGDFSYTVGFDSEPKFSIKLNIEDFNLNISEIDVSGADNVIF